jgi:anti-anti-sigma factor
MCVEFKDSNDYLIVSIKGKLDSLNSKEVGKKIDEWIKNSNKDVVFDFEGLDYISSAGLQILVTIAKNRSAIGKYVYIYKPNDMIDNIITITGFYSFLKKIDEL